MDDRARSQLEDRVRAVIEGREAFDDVALALAEAQRAASPVIARYQARRGGTPRTWRDVAPLPIAAFKHAELFFGGGAVARTFESSGTSGANKSRALFSASGLALMDASIDANAARRLFPDGRATRVLVLTPPPESAPQLIMVAGMRRLVARFGLPGSGFVVPAPGGPVAAGVGGATTPAQALAGALEAAVSDGVAVTLCGASFGLVLLMDALPPGRAWRLPAGSRVLHAGGFKGRSREVGPEALGQALEASFGVAPARVVNLLGMTELASQLWEAGLSEGGAPTGEKLDAPWTRSRVLDPVTLGDVPVGGVGLLAHWDLANVERPFAVLTDDLGQRTARGVRVLGRAAAADAKGCSLTLDDLLSRQGSRAP